ncbi:unnamed protein product [Mesocestoides corti]|nr:unnamed protein product [Mesocestoides corti]
MEEKFKCLVEWMQVIAYSTKSVSFGQDEYEFSDEAVQRLKTKIAEVITRSREETSKMEDIQGLLATKDRQIFYLKKMISRLVQGLRRSNEAEQDTSKESENSEAQKRLHYLESQLEEARMQLAQFEKGSSHPTLESSALHESFRQSLADLLNRSGWICVDSEEGILGVVSRVLITLSSKTEACSSLQSRLTEMKAKLSDFERKIADDDYRIEHLEDENSKLCAQLSRSSHKSVEFSPCTVDLEGCNAKLIQFLHELQDQLSIDPVLFSQMGITDQRELVLENISKLTAPSPAKSDCDLAPRLHKRIQRLQDELMSRDLQLKSHNQKVAKLEEQLAAARKGETEANEKQAFAEQRIARYRKTEAEATKLKKEISQLKTQVKENSEFQMHLEEKLERIVELEGTVKNLEEIRHRQASKIGELIAARDAEQAATSRKLLQQEESQRIRFTNELHETNQLLEQLSKEAHELRNFRSVVGRLLGMRVDQLAAPNKEIIHGVERLLKEAGGNCQSRSTAFSARSVSPRKALHSSSARIGFTHAFSDSEPLPEGKDSPMQHSEMGQSRSSSRIGPTQVSNSSASSPSGHQQPSPRDTRRY